MTSFRAKIEEYEKTHAYMQGVDAFNAKIAAECPYAFRSKEYDEWYDGYLDAEYIYRLINE